MNQPEVSGSAGENFVRSTWNICSKCTEMRQFCSPGFSNHTRGSNRDAKIWKTSPEAEGFQWAGLMPMMSMWGMWCVVIISYLVDCKWAGHEPWQSLEDYHQKFEYVEDLCENGAEAAEWWPEGAVHSGVLGYSRGSWKQTRLASDELWIFEYDSETKHPGVFSGRAWSCQGWRKQDSQSPKSNFCWSCSLMWGTLFTYSSCHRTRWSTSMSTKRSYSIFFVQCMRVVAEQLLVASLRHNDLNIRQFLTENIAVSEQLPYSLDLAPCDFFLSPSSRGPVFWM